MWIVARTVLLRVSTVYCTHKVLINKEHHSVCPSLELGLPPTPLPQASVLSPRTKGWRGAQSPVSKGVGESQFRRQKKLSTLPTL
jgi:hypothetical protein